MPVEDVMTRDPYTIDPDTISKRKATIPAD